MLKQLALSKNPPTIDLTDIESEIVRYLAQGKSSKDIAIETGYSQRTIESKRLVIEKKTFSKNSCELINYAYKNGLLIIDSRSLWNT
jgi:DNA-binding NarL/FixJ family response regulator